MVRPAQVELVVCSDYSNCTPGQSSILTVPVGCPTDVTCSAARLEVTSMWVATPGDWNLGPQGADVNCNEPN